MCNNDKTYEIIKLIIAPFAGAFFAFLFLRFAEWLRFRTKRRKNYLRALGKIQLMGNSNYNALASSISSIDQIIKIVKEATDENKSPYSGNRLDNLTNDNDVLLDLRNDDFINEYFSYSLSIEKHNHDVDNINHFHESMKNSRLAGQITPQNYDENMLRFIDDLKLYRKYCLDFMEKTEVIIARSRVLMKIESTFFRKLFKIHLEKFNKSFIKKYDVELLVLKQEIEDIKNKNKKERDRILSS